MGDRSNGYASGRARRTQIIDAAVAAFGRAGFSGATMSDIATACGISRPGLLHHFESKEALLTAVLGRRDAVDRETFTRVGSPLQALVDITASNAQTPGIMELYTVLSAEAVAVDHPARDYFVSLYERLLADLGDALAVAQDDGELRRDLDPYELARDLIAVRDGLMLQAALRAPQGIDPAAELARFIRRHVGADVRA
jgi:AcrR family transcriptional regulator